MFTQSEPQEFVTEVISNVWQNGLVKKIPEIYTKDVIGHFQQGEFGYEDIKERMLALNESCKQRQFTIQDLVVVDNLIIFRMRQTWLSPSNGGLCESMLVAIYRIRDKKVCELWILSDQEMDSYSEVSKSVEENIDRFQVIRREKSAFLQKMTDHLYFKTSPPASLSSIEVECLFYYLNGYTAKEVAKAMSISHRTVEGYIGNIKQKYQCTTRRELRLKLFPRQAD